MLRNCCLLKFGDEILLLEKKKKKNCAMNESQFKAKIQDFKVCISNNLGPKQQFQFPNLITAAASVMIFLLLRLFFTLL